jgi:hypothetical protein
MSSALKRLLIVAGVLVLGVHLYLWRSYPDDRSPLGAYLRIMAAVNQDDPRLIFPYLEEEAQHACYTLSEYRKKSVYSISRAYPDPERSLLLARYRPVADAADGSEVFAIYARERGWLDRLRRDMSGVEREEVDGERASLETAKGTRYPFRRRPNGIWGLTWFTAPLVAEAEKAARDASAYEAAAQDYERAGRGQPR